MRPYILPLALLFIAFTDPSIAQSSARGQAQVVVAAGAPLIVECVVRVEQAVQWQADGAAVAPSLRVGKERALGDGRLVARLQASRATPQHAGLYTCHRAAPPVRVIVLPADTADGDATAGTATGTDAGAGAGSEPADTDGPRKLVLFELYRPLQFNCTLPKDVGVTQYQWSKNGSAVPGLGSPKGPVLEENGAVLTLKRAFEDDFGNYTCRVGGVAVQSWQAHAKSIARVPANTNVVEGQKFSITCKLIGKPYPTVSWTYAAAEGENATEIDTAAPASRFRARASPQGAGGAVLEAAAAARGDAGVYACVPPHGAAAATTLRVKDVYAALWPFLGICLEVFILCAIILVYEKRRTKSEPEDSDADTHDQKKS